MKKLILFYIFLGFFLSAKSQEWRSFTGPDLGLNGTTLGSTYYLWDPFKINPYDNSIWIGFNMKLHHVTNEGNATTYDYITHPDLFGGVYSGNRPTHFDFNASETYFLTSGKGLHQFNAGNVVTLHQSNSLGGLFVEADTVYSLKSGDSPLKFVNNTFDSNFNQGPGPSIFVSRNGFYWGGGGSSYLAYYTPEFNVVFAQNDDVLLSNTNHDFKFKRNSDSLYTSSEKGFSIAYDTTFYDTLTPFNSVNMPHSNIVEFEFDKNDNIWALFGDENDDPIAIGYCENRVWSKYFDSSNSPIDFTNLVGIEIDTFNNVWVNDLANLHVFIEYDSPSWVSLVEHDNPPLLHVYPNPAENKITVQHTENIIQIQLKDINGKAVPMNFTTIADFKIELDIQPLTTGMYFLEVETKTGKSVSKIVKQ